MGRQATDVVWLGLEASGQSSRLGVTAEHPLYVEGRGWVQAGELAPGDRIVDADGGVITVVSAELDDRPTLVHNLEVAGTHTYFAGELEAWGHNRWKGRGQFYKQLLSCPKTPKSVKGWIKRHQGPRGGLSNIPNPPGFDEGHPLRQTRAKGCPLDPKTARLELIRDNRARGGRTGGAY